MDLARARLKASRLRAALTVPGYRETTWRRISTAVAGTGAAVFLVAAIHVGGAGASASANVGTLAMHRTDEAFGDDIRFETQRTALTSTAPMRIEGKIESGIASSIEEAGASSKVAKAYIRLLATFAGPNGVGPGDSFDIVISPTVQTKKGPAGGDVIYAGLYRTDGRNLLLAQWTVGGRLRWYDASTVGGSPLGLARPVPGQITSDFGSRFHPILGYTRMHKGIDFHATAGTPIQAAQTGWVEHAGWAGSFGNQVMLQHGSGYETSYSHMSAVAVRPGQLVHRGDVIGYVGATGLATGPHLHYEVHLGGQAINPETIDFSSGTQMSMADLEGYQNRLRALLSVPVEPRHVIL